MKKVTNERTLKEDAERWVKYEIACPYCKKDLNPHLMYNNKSNVWESKILSCAKCLIIFYGRGEEIVVVPIDWSNLHWVA